MSSEPIGLHRVVVAVVTTVEAVDAADAVNVAQAGVRQMLGGHGTYIRTHAGHQRLVNIIKAEPLDTLLSNRELVLSERIAVDPDYYSGDDHG